MVKHQGHDIPVRADGHLFSRMLLQDPFQHGHGTLAGFHARFAARESKFGIKKHPLLGFPKVFFPQILSRQLSLPQIFFHRDFASAIASQYPQGIHRTPIRTGVEPADSLLD
ncbi:hypothetical protein D1872_308690 [compost metagenome]